MKHACCLCFIHMLYACAVRVMRVLFFVEVTMYAYAYVATYQTVYVAVATSLGAM